MRPLEGIRILDLTRVVSGPFCTMILGDLGADVIKIEEPVSGDDSRAFGPPFVGGESAYYLSVNRNKRSCCIDLKSDDGRALLERMIPACDVLVDNFRPGTLERLGLGDPRLLALNPALIRCSITGFGRDGREAHRPGYDLIIQGESGLMDITGFPDGPPTKVGTSIADLVTGLYAVQAILAAVLHRTRTGDSDRIDVSMLDSMASLLTFNAGMYFATGSSPVRRGNAHPTIFPYETFEAADGWINLGVANDKFWLLFCGEIGVEGLATDPRFDTAPRRVENRQVLRSVLEPILRRRTRCDWLSALDRVGVPCGAIKSVAEVCEAAAGRGQVAEMDHPTAGRIRAVMSPFRYADRPAGGAAGAPTAPTPPPCQGEQSAQILAELAGVEAADYAALEARAIVGNQSARAVRAAPR